MFDKSLIFYLYQRLKFGPKRLNYSDYEFRSRKEDLQPVIFLSTGRCGTKWITERLEGSSKYVPIHYPRPLMRVQGRMMYEYDFNSIDEKTFHLLCEIFLAGREEMFVRAKRADRELAITDSRGTFYAYLIASLFPKAKFIFVHRHPLQVIRSGLKRGWYTLENESELSRITPRPDDSFYSSWEQMSPTQKIAWLWRETNEWILEFLKTIPEERKHAIGFNQWQTPQLKAMFDFMNADVSSKEIAKNLKVASNAQKSNRNPQFSGWTDKNEKEALEICGDLAKRLNYDL